MEAHTPRRYRVGDIIPTRGTVVEIGLTAYRVSGREWGMGEWVPFYGPNGVDHVEPVTPLVVLGP